MEYTESGEEIAATWAPPDIIRSRTQETGKTKADLFRAAGLPLVEASNDREAGWLSVKSVLRIQPDGLPKMQIFRNCRRLIHDLPLLQIDPKHPTDCMTEPHDITHICDSLRYGMIAWTSAAPEREEREERLWTKDMYDDWCRASSDVRVAMEKMMGGAPTGYRYF